MAKTKLTKKDIVSVANKLGAFAKQLPKQERDVLGWILTRAQTAPPIDMTAAASKAVPAGAEVQGFKGSLASQLARSVGLGPTRVADVTVTVGWGYRFANTPTGPVGDLTPDE
jgi:hypothetical protein